jgi:uridine kinase
LLNLLQNIEILPKVGKYENWDCPEAIDFEKLKIQILKEQDIFDGLLFVEGFLLFPDKELLEMLDFVIFLKISQRTCEKRRFERDEWIQTEPDYFPSIVWPAYMKVIIDTKHHYNVSLKHCFQVQCTCIEF